jgi:hypothetical protein
VAPQTPLLLVDNLFDLVTSYPGATLDASSEVIGREAFRAVDYERDRSRWEPLSDGGGSDLWIRVHLTVARAVDYAFLDRGHNLAGKSIFLEGSADGISWPTSVQLNVPASGVIGGTPASPAMAATEEAAAWTIIPATTARTWWRFRFPYSAGFVPQVTGVMAGTRTQLMGYSRVFDDDAGERTQIAQQSTAGWRATDTTYGWRRVEISLGVIAPDEYDTTIRMLRGLLFEKNLPWVNLLDYGTYPERAWMMQYDGTQWGFPKSRVHRDGRIVGREYGPRLV